MKKEQKMEPQHNSDSTADNSQVSPTCPKPIVMRRFFLHQGANGTYIFKNKKSKDNPYYTATHILYCIPTKRKRITQKLEVGAICNDVDGNIMEILKFKKVRSNGA